MPQPKPIFVGILVPQGSVLELLAFICSSCLLAYHLHALFFFYFYADDKPICFSFFSSFFNSTVDIIINLGIMKWLLSIFLKKLVSQTILSCWFFFSNHSMQSSYSYCIFGWLYHHHHIL